MLRRTRRHPDLILRVRRYTDPWIAEIRARRWGVGVTAQEFEEAYAERSGLTVTELRKYGRVVISCDCGWQSCEGWQSVSSELAVEIAANRIAAIQ